MLFLHQGPEDYAKLCFERLPSGDAAVVSVVTRGTSDDAVGPVVDAESVLLRISRMGPIFAFHFSADGQRWELVRLFRFRNPDRPTHIGPLAQSPTGESCTATFDQFSCVERTLRDPRDGS